MVEERQQDVRRPDIVGRYLWGHQDEWERLHLGHLWETLGSDRGQVTATLTHQIAYRMLVPTRISVAAA